jgi:PAS domain S-box-containing protein
MMDDLINPTRLAQKHKASQHSCRLFGKDYVYCMWIQTELRAIYKHIPIMLCTLDTNRSVLYANRAFCQFAGVSEDQLQKGRACGVFGCVNASNDPRGCGFASKCAQCKLRIAIDNTIKTGRKHRNVEYQATLMRYGSSRHVSMLGSTVRLSVNGQLRILLCLQDMTKYMLAEQRLRESEARLSALFKHSTAGILLTAPDGRVLAANPAACQLLQRSEKEICSLGKSGLVDNRNRRTDTLLGEISKRGYATSEMNFVRADGVRLPVQITSTVFETTKGPRTSMVFLDVSEKKQAEERIHQFTQKLLAVREEEKSRLSTTLHHEVGSVIIGVTARLDAAENDLSKGLVEEAQSSLKVCRKVFEQATARLKGLAMELRPPDLDLLGLRASLKRLLDEISDETSLIVHFTDTLRSENISPEGQTLLYRAAQECLNNVIKHANAHEVNVRLSRVRQQIQLSIADDGKGFNPSDLTTLAPSHLGLRSIQEMAASLEGTLDIISHQKKGTKVTITIFCRRDKQRENKSKSGKDYGIHELILKGDTLPLKR